MLKQNIFPFIRKCFIFIIGIIAFELSEPVTEVRETISRDNGILQALNCSFGHRRASHVPKADNGVPAESSVRRGSEINVPVIKASVMNGHDLTCVARPPPVAKRKEVPTVTGEPRVMFLSNRNGRLSPTLSFVIFVTGLGMYNLVFTLCTKDSFCTPERDTKMFDAVLSLCLQLCVSLLVLSRIRGEVSAPPHLQALVDLPFTIGCNFTLGPEETLEQVRWEDGKSRTLLTYQPGQPASITSHRVDQATSHQYTSAITIKQVEPGDEGIYICKFDVYPNGQQIGRVHLSVTARVTMEGNTTAVSGKLATLSCSYGLPESVQQVLWKKTAEQGDTSDVASFGKRAGATVTKPFRDRVSVSHTLAESRLSIKPVRTEDEGCYTCEFNTYPEGSRSATACLTVYVLPKPEVTYRTVFQDVIEANCTALARPAAQIAWNVAGDNKTLGPAVFSSFQQGDGTTLVVSTILIQADLLNDQSVKCLVSHQGLESPMSVSLNTKIGKALAILISVTAVAAVLIICMCICLWKCFIRRYD
ncbi:hypothetical protein SKAU_G00229870 [Synaphobranchus kaupii]|uniref:Ig-like domain-containing protein n=1 Tax=Synaphobranchus kaupii TaxID=118154 RepID=A0A9Q1F5F2_SYNKA|nr:hypothetical protein SKAU_G00229870 [Synaphobranchus kaupii]